MEAETSPSMRKGPFQPESYVPLSPFGEEPNVLLSQFTETLLIIFSFFSISGST